MSASDWPEPKGYFTVDDLAYLHGTAEAEVLRLVVEVLGLPPKDRFDSQEFLKVNRILGPVPEPGEIRQEKSQRGVPVDYLWHTSQRPNTRRGP